MPPSLLYSVTISCIAAASHGPQLNSGGCRRPEDHMFSALMKMVRKRFEVLLLVGLSLLCEYIVELEYKETPFLVVLSGYRAV